MARLRILVLALSLSVLTACGSSTPAAGPPAPVPDTFPLPKDASAAAAKAGLPMLGQEMLEIHYHSHLDITLRGTSVRVPAGIGIDAAKAKISPLHTHDATGIVHIESAQDIPFTLGQFFTEWGQPLSSQQVGTVSVAPGEEVRVYRNGEQVSGDPAAVKFTGHAEIVIWIGATGDKPQVPKSFTFPQGL